MQVFKFLNRIATSPLRSRSKAAVLKKLAATPQENQGVVNLHRIDVKNAGDYYSAPHLYFDRLKGSQLDIFDYKSPDKAVTDHWIEAISRNALIIGGGGLLNRGSFEKQLKLFEHLADKGKKTVLWGVGHNAKDPRDFGKQVPYNIDIEKFGLVGTRDYRSPGEWVPCVSCLHPVFDRTYEVKQEIGIVFHKKTLKKKSLTSKFGEFPSTSNTTDIDSLVQFIGSSETIITDSYHAMYWSILLGKKVAVIPNSSKFYDFKYHPVISDFENCIQDARKAPSYSGVLEECREINYEFSKKVFDYLEL